jgi:hypothetical protein
MDTGSKTLMERWKEVIEKKGDAEKQATQRHCVVYRNSRYLM